LYFLTGRLKDLFKLNLLVLAIRAATLELQFSSDSGVSGQEKKKVHTHYAVFYYQDVPQ